MKAIRIISERKNASDLPDNMSPASVYWLLFGEQGGAGVAAGLDCFRGALVAGHHQAAVARVSSDFGRRGQVPASASQPSNSAARCSCALLGGSQPEFGFRNWSKALSVAMHKPNVYIDLSGWSPKYFPPQLIQYANTQLKHKMLFGTDFPLITPERWIKDFETAGFKDEVKPLIFKENAIKMLRLTG